MVCLALYLTFIKIINVESAEELWDSLESKYMVEDASSKTFLKGTGQHKPMEPACPAARFSAVPSSKGNRLLTRKGLLGPNGGRYGGIGGRGNCMAGRVGGWLARRLIVSKEGCGDGGLVARGGLLDGYDGDDGGEVNGGGVVLGVFKRRLGEIPGEVIRERGGDTIGLDGGAVW
ncbi:hypothetical protein Tco_0796431 [Tanacetum coccineum]